MNYTACGGRRRRRRTMKGGVYEQSVANGGIAGFPVTKSIHEVEAADYSTRGGNNNTSGGRRRRRRTHKRKGGKRRKTHRGGGGSYGTPVSSDLALNSPRAGYGYVGKGIAGFTDPTPVY
jgi:hypothetical protein